MAFPPGDRRISWHAKDRQPSSRRRHAPTPLCHGEEALYSADCFACFPVRFSLALFLVQHCLIFLPYREPLLYCPPALLRDERVGRAQLPVFLARRAQRLRFVPCETLRPVCCAYPSRHLPGRLSRAGA